MQVCRICEGNCYDGELINGICHECREAERKREREELLDRLLAGPSEQLSFLADHTGHSAYRRRFGWN